MPFFSVVIPLYNKEKFVKAAIDSVLSQTFSDFELLIIDDCSTDGSFSIASQFNDSRIRIINHQHNKGLSAARNSGIANSQADFIAFLDADDLWKPNFLRTIFELIQKFPDAGLFATAYEEKYPDHIVDIHKNVAFAKGQSGIISDFFIASSHQPILWYGCTVVRKEVFAVVGSFDETITLGEDIDFNIRANLKYSVAYCNISCALYTMQSENQITRSNIAERKITDFNSYEKFANQNPSLKLYLDVNRYALAMEYKIAGNRHMFEKLRSEIDYKNLTALQQILLKLPTPLVNQIRKMKKFLLNHKIRVTSFSK